MRQILLILTLFSYFNASAQQQLGMRLDRHAGLYASAMNPASIAFTPAKWEISLFTADIFAHQNYGFLLNTSISEVIRRPEQIKLLSEIAEDPNASQAIPLDFFNKGQISGIVQSRIAGPAVSVKFNNRHTFGLGAAMRMAVSSYRNPAFLRFNSISQLNYGVTYNIDPVKVTAMGWREISGNYTYSNFDGPILFALGISPKFLTGYQAGFTRVNADFDYTPVVSDTARFGSANWDYGFTTDILYSDAPEDYILKANGHGAGADLGVSWAMPLEDTKNPSEYLWRLGVSVVDLGFIRFNKNAERHAIDFNSLAIVPGDTIAAAVNTSIEEGVRAVSRVLLGNPDASLASNRFTIGLPTTVSAQFDYRLHPLFYVAAVFTQRAPLARFSLRGASTLAIVPRLEHKWVAVSLPLALSDYRSPRLGIGARLGYLYLGSDDILSWVGKKRLTGTDFYIGLKIHAFPVTGKKKKNSRGGLRARDRHWDNVGCFNQ